MKTITKKEFKEQCSTNHVYGRGAQRINTIYFDWKATPEGTGFKFGVASSVENCTKAELLDIAYDFIVNQKFAPYYVYTRFAQYDNQRFKVPISFSHKSWN